MDEEESVRPSRADNVARTIRRLTAQQPSPADRVFRLHDLPVVHEAIQEHDGQAGRVLACGKSILTQ